MKRNWYLFLFILILGSALLPVSCGDDDDDDDDDEVTDDDTEDLDDDDNLDDDDDFGSEGPDDDDDDDDDTDFPVTDGNVFSIQYRNSTADPITIWLMGSQPPCSEAQALNCDSVPGGTPWASTDYSSKWEELRTQGVFSDSGTEFTVIGTDGTVTAIDVSNNIDLEAGEVLRIVPPIVDNKPQWYWAENGTAKTAGVNGWATGQGITMNAPEPVLLYEYNLDSAHNKIWWDLSAVDGLNANATMTYEGPGCGTAENCNCDSSMPKVCNTNLAEWNSTNDGCPYIKQFSSANSCPNPKFYDTIDGSVDTPAWVVPTSEFTTDDVSTDHSTIWETAGSPTGAEMAAAASGDPSVKPAYHIWWSTNTVGQSWLTYLQQNDAGDCNAYGWAYDEKRWKDGDSFDDQGNPPDNDDVKANVSCEFTSDTYINIDITYVM